MPDCVNRFPYKYCPERLRVYLSVSAREREYFTLGSQKGCEIVLGFFFGAGLGFFFGFLGWYHLPSVCNGLELEFVILHGICHIWACSPFILHGIYYMWACSPSILYGICHILACSPSILHGMFYMWACSPSILYGICHILACSPSILHGFPTFWHVHLPFCMGCSTCEHVHPNIYRCGSLGLDKKRVGGIEGGR